MEVCSGDKRKVGRRMCVNERETSVTVELQGAEVVKVDKFKHLRSTHTRKDSRQSDKAQGKESTIYTHTDTQRANQ